MARELIPIRIIKSTRVNERTIRRMEEVYFSTLMGIHMKGIGLMGRNKEKVSMYMQMVTTTKANGNSTNATAPA